MNRLQQDVGSKALSVPFFASSGWGSQGLHRGARVAVGAGLLLLLAGAGVWFWWWMPAQSSGRVKTIKPVSPRSELQRSGSRQVQGQAVETDQVSLPSKAKDQSSALEKNRPDSSKKHDETAPALRSQAPKAPVEMEVGQPASSTGAAKRHGPASKKGISPSPPAAKAVAPPLQDSTSKLQKRSLDAEAEATQFRLALLHQQTGDYTGALEIYRQLLALNPKNPTALNNMGVVLKEMGQLDEASVALKKALDLDPTYDKAHTNLGVVLQLQDRPQAAIEHHLRALALNEKNWESMVNLGLLFWSEGNLAEAKRFFSMALSVRYEASILHHLGLVSEQQGQRLEATYHYREALEKGKGLNPQLRKRIQLRLGELLGESRLKGYTKETKEP